MKKIDLVNSEGPLLVLVKEKELFLILDETKRELVKLTRTALELFLEGQILICDSKGVEWDFSKVPNGMKIDSNKLKVFLENGN